MNIYDIAKEANVSIATVSRVLNKSSAVKKETRDKVMEVIDKYNYRPSDIARGLAINKTNTVGIMVPDVRNPFHASASYLLEQYLLDEGYNSILCNTSEESVRKVRYFELLTQKEVEGIILLGASYGDKELEKVFEEVNKKIPVVIINNYIGKNSTFVICDGEKGVYESIEHLNNKGYKKPIYIYGDYQNTTSFSKKDGFIRGLKDFYPNQKIEDSIFYIQDDISSYEKFLKVLREDANIDSIQFERDTAAIKFLKVAENNGFRVPEDLAIIGFDNIDFTEFTHKRLSTIDHKIDEHCELAVELIVKKIKGEKVKNNNYIVPKFIEKETT